MQTGFYRSINGVIMESGKIDFIWRRDISIKIAAILQGYPHKYYF